jgi:hypothetical protein
VDADKECFLGSKSLRSGGNGVSEALNLFLSASADVNCLDYGERSDKYWTSDDFSTGTLLDSQTSVDSFGTLDYILLDKHLPPSAHLATGTEMDSFLWSLQDRFDNLQQEADEQGSRQH